MVQAVSCALCGMVRLGLLVRGHSRKFVLRRASIYRCSRRSRGLWRDVAGKQKMELPGNCRNREHALYLHVYTESIVNSNLGSFICTGACIMYMPCILCWSASLRESETVTETGREERSWDVWEMPVIAECLSL
jgi:hypothetical protein